MAVAGLDRVAKAGFKTEEDYAYTAIREAIGAGGLAPDERLSLSGLAAVLEVGEITVREALKRLESEGLVVGTGPDLSVAPVVVKAFSDFVSYGY